VYKTAPARADADAARSAKNAGLIRLKFEHAEKAITMRRLQCSYQSQ